MNQLKCLLCILVLGLNCYYSVGEITSEGELIFAHVLYRHGDRTPIEPYPTDPWNDPKFWPTGWGQLTNTGKQQHLELGKYLKNRYKTLISEKYNRTEVFVRSTDVDRTLMSAMSNLAGLYPPAEDQVWNPDIHWQPIPVHTVPEKQDSVLAGKKYCPAYEAEFERVATSEEYRKIDHKNSDLYKFLTFESGRIISNIEGVELLYNCLFIEELYNKTLPAWTKDVYPGKMIDIAAMSFETSTHTDLLKRLKVGPLLKEMFAHFEAKAAGKLTPDRSLWIYSAHDTTVANLLNALGAFKPHSPPYTACVMFELRRISNEYFIELYYRADGVTSKLKLSLCGDVCPLEKGLKSYEHLLPEDWEVECRTSTGLMRLIGINGDKADLLVAVGVVAGAVVSVTIFAAILLVVFKRWHTSADRTGKHRYTRIDS